MTAGEILGMVRAAFDDLRHVEVNGADAVGTDAYPALRDAWPRLVELLRSEAADVRIAAAYALAFIVEHAPDTQAALDMVAQRAQLPLERAAMIIAAGRLRGSIVQWKGETPYSWDGIDLPAEAARESSRVVKTAIVIAALFSRSRWGRKVKPAIEVALRAVEREVDGSAVSVGPWGGGDLGRLARAMRETCLVVRGHGGAHAVSGAPPPEAFDEHDHDDHDHDEHDHDDHDHDDHDDHDHDDHDHDEHDHDDAPAPIAEREVADPYTQERPVRAATSRIELAGLRDLDWAHLEHAYGAATGVPGMIEALGSPDEEDRRWGREALSASINHQGSVFSASAPAVPFLVKLLEAGVDDRAWILGHLAGLAVGDPRWHLSAELAEAASPAFDAVSAAAPVFVRLISDPDPEVRATAAMVLSFVVPPEGASATIKRVLAMETNRYTRASLLLALGYVGRRTRSTADRAAIERYLEDDCMLIAGCAAIALAQIDKDACSPHARAVLARTITDAPPTTGTWPWNGGDVAGFARMVRLGILTVDEMIVEAEAAHARGDWPSAREYAVKAFDRTFRDDVHGPARLWLPHELDDRRRRILRFLSSTSRLTTRASPGLCSRWTCGARTVPASRRMSRRPGDCSATHAARSIARSSSQTFTTRAPCRRGSRSIRWSASAHLSRRCAKRCHRSHPRSSSRSSTTPCRAPFVSATAAPATRNRRRTNARRTTRLASSRSRRRCSSMQGSSARRARTRSRRSR